MKKVNPFHVLGKTCLIRLDVIVGVDLLNIDENEEYKHLTDDGTIPDFVLSIQLEKIDSCYFVADKNAAKFLAHYLDYLHSILEDDSFEFPEDFQDLMNFYKE